MYKGPNDPAQASWWLGKALDALVATPPGTALQADARNISISGALVTTDPPYYDNVPYSDLSDFFYIWLRRSLAGVHDNLLKTVLTPKDNELVADPIRHGDRADNIFESGFEEVFARLRTQVPSSSPMAVFYAFKQSESDGKGEASTGWEKLLEGMIRGAWTVTATWPVRTERGGRIRDIGSNALASSVVLACRPRSEAAATTDRRGLIAALRAELPTALKELQQGSIAPVDLAQAAIGPGMAVFSSYAQVTEPDGSAMRVRTALALINQVLAEVLSEQEGDLDVDSRFALKWFEQFGWGEGPFGDAETLAKATNTSTAGLERAGIFRARAGKARLIEPGQLAAGYDPASDDRVTVWEIVLHLVKRMEEQGIDAAGRFMARARQVVDIDEVKELAYLLYSICDRRRWAQDALRFNNLVSSWSDVDHVARRVPAGPADTQGDLLDELAEGGEE
jgi:putative DNA methylase